MSVTINHPDKIATDGMLRPFWHVSLLFCGLLGPICFVVTYFTFGSISPDFDMLRQPIGRLELLNYGWIQSVNFILLGLFTGAFAIGLSKELQDGFGATILPLLHLITAIGMILMGICINEPVHTCVSIFTFVSLIVSFFVFAIRFAGDPKWKHWVIYTNFCAIIMMILIAVCWYAVATDSPYAAIFEHLILLLRMVWFISFIIRLLWGDTPEEIDMEVNKRIYVSRNTTQRGLDNPSGVAQGEDFH